ncbi:MAG: DsbA family protein [Rhodocyclaceae bacterium]|jgi:2-hydroxychromene-2-carboxylate isomerase|nr:DsbA family protein [Rhodocyclaceae bacterium]MCA3160313.1 DsbA family protein [Burkholderiales bacterium]MCA3592704.1 DsbA family protein [Methylocystis sp.]MCA3653704.1 DsbA family protein [Methylobacterium sp.]
MNAPINLHFDFVSPYSYFAFSQREAIEERTGRRVVLRPVLVGAIMAEVGNVPTSVTCKAKRTYLTHDLARWAKRLRVPVQPHPMFGRFSTEPLVKAALASGDDVVAFSQVGFAAVWQQAAPLHDLAAMDDWFLARHPAMARHWMNRETATQALADAVQLAVSEGAFGVPHFFGDRGAFFGNDRIDFLIEAYADA